MKTSRLTLALVLPLAACTVGGAGDDVNPPGDDVGPETLAGSVAMDRTVSGAVTLLNDTTIEPGVTLTVAAGTVIEATTGKQISVKGTLLVQGAAGSEVMIAPPAGGGAWAGFVAEAGGVIDVAYVEGSDVANFLYSKSGSTSTIDHVTLTGIAKAAQIEGMVTITKSSFEGVSGITVLQTANVDVSDTYFLGTSGDTVIQTGGVLVLDHVNVGNTSTNNDHCAMHLNAGSDITVSYSNISDTTVGLMIGGTDGASFTYNNFENLTNLEDISSDVLNTNGVFDHNYITGTPATIPGITITNPETIRVADAGPRP